MPNAETVACMKRPEQMPNVVTTPSRRPPRSTLRTTSIVSGPGVTVSTAAARANEGICGSIIAAFRCHVDGLTVLPAAPGTQCTHREVGRAAVWRDVLLAVEGPRLPRVAGYLKHGNRIDWRSGSTRHANRRSGHHELPPLEPRRCRRERLEVEVVEEVHAARDQRELMDRQPAHRR